MLAQRLKNLVFTFLLFLISLGCQSCASTGLLSQRGSYLRAYHAGCFEEAEAHLDAIAKAEMPKQQYTQSKEAAWILLDRATTRFIMGKTEEALQDYASAIEALDYYDQDLPAETLGQILLQDETGAYQAADFEQVLARVYFAFALLHQGDESNAYALLRQAEEYQQEKLALYHKVPFTRHYRLANNGLSQYLFAVLLEKRGDLANANILYQQALASIPEAAIEMKDTKNPQATVLVICHNGNAPYKISTTCPASVASAAALEFLLATRSIDPAWSTLTGIPIPALQQWPFSYPQPIAAWVDQTSKPLIPFYNVTQAAADELEQKLPVIVARGTARLLARRCAVGYLGERDPALGALADLTMWVANTNTRADTRSWTTLPARIDVARFPADPGCHSITIQTHWQPPQTYSLNLKANDLCVIHIFNIHPGTMQVLVPNRFLATQGECL